MKVFFSLETLNCDLTRVKNVLAPDTRIKSAISFPNCRCRFYNQITINGKTRLSSELFRNFQDFSTPNYSKLHEQHWNFKCFQSFNSSSWGRRRNTKIFFPKFLTCNRINVLFTYLWINLIQEELRGHKDVPVMLNYC